MRRMQITRMSGKTRQNKDGRIIQTLEEHISMFLPLFVTYIFGFIFAWFTWRNLDSESQKNIFLIFKCILESLIPSTITYVLVNTIQNLVNMIKSNTEHFLCNILSIVLVSVYEFIYFVYGTNYTSIFLLIFAIIMTVGVVIVSVFSYFEIYNSTHRNHDLNK